MPKPRSPHPAPFANPTFFPENRFQDSIELIAINLIHWVDEWRLVSIEGANIEGIHKSRVGFRRIRTVLKLAKADYQFEKLKSLLVDLNRLGNSLGEVRDRDVFHFNIQAWFNAQHPTENFFKQVWEPTFSENYQIASEIARAALLNDLYARIRQNIINLREIRLPEKEMRTIAQSLPIILANQRRKIDHFAYLADSSAPYQDYHRLRLLIKNHRYTLEFFQSALSPILAQQLIKHLTSFQTYLGELNDCVVAQEIISNAKPSAAVEDILTQYQQEVDNKRQKLIDSFPQAWITYLSKFPTESLQPLITNSSTAP